MEKQETRDIQSLISIFFPFGEESLIKFGEFSPYAGATTIEGEFVSVGKAHANENPDSKKIIAQLKYDLQKGNSQYLVVAIFYDVQTKVNTTGETSDAIAVYVEHKNGNAAYEIFYPYKLGDDKNFIVDESYGNTVPREIFLS